MHRLKMDREKRAKVTSLMQILIVVVMFVAAVAYTEPVYGEAAEMRAPFLKEVPTIDGNWTGTEWDDAIEYPIANGVNVTYVRMKHDDVYLYVLLDSPWDTTRSRWFESETTWLAFDTSHNHGSTPQTDDWLFDTEFSSTPECHGHGIAWRGNGTQWKPVYNEHTDAGYLAESNSGWHHHLSSSPHSSTPHRTEELRIPLIYVGEVGRMVGFYVMIVDDKNDPDGSGPTPGSYVEWPSPPVAQGDPSGWPNPPGYKDPCPLPDTWGHLISVPTLADEPYAPVADFIYTPSSPVAGKNLTFDAGASLSGWNGSRIMNIVSYAWDFGDGTDVIVSTPVTKHIYATGGSYSVNLTVTDEQGWSNSVSETLTVSSKASSQVVLQVNPSSIALGDHASITVAVFCDGEPKVGVAILIEHRKAGTETWSMIGQSETNSTGAWSMDWTPTETGTFEVRGSWNGDAETQGTMSELKTVTIEEAVSVDTSIPIWQILAIAALLGVAILIGGMYFFKIRKTKARAKP